MSVSRLRTPFKVVMSPTVSVDQGLDVMGNMMRRTGFSVAAQKQNPLVRGVRQKRSDKLQAEARRAVRLRRWGIIDEKVRNILWARVRK